MDTKKVFFDTNIILDIIDAKRLNHIKVKNIWELLIRNKSKIVISEDMLSTIFYINKDNMYTLDFFDLIHNRWEIVAFGKEVIKHAIGLSRERELDLEDVLQCLCAKENNCDIFISNDKKFYDCGIKIMTVDTFLCKI